MEERRRKIISQDTANDNGIVISKVNRRKDTLAPDGGERREKKIKTHIGAKKLPCHEGLR